MKVPHGLTIWSLESVIIAGCNKVWDKARALTSCVVMKAWWGAHTEFLRLHFEPFGSTPTTLSRG